MTILGIDPGYERVGVAVVEKAVNQKEKLIFSDCIVTKKTIPHHQRLALLGESISKIIDRYKPNVLSIEKLFFNENQKTALQVAEARGVMLFVASDKGLEVSEFTPLEIKMAITGYGRADKKQIKYMTERLVTISKKIRYDDEYDALAAALTASSYLKTIPTSFPQSNSSPLAKKNRFGTNRKS